MAQTVCTNPHLPLKGSTPPTRFIPFLAPTSMQLVYRSSSGECDMRDTVCQAVEASDHRRRDNRRVAGFYSLRPPNRTIMVK